MASQLEEGRFTFLAANSVTLIAIPLCEILISYLKNKPTGMQTFLDLLLIDLYRYYQLYVLLNFVSVLIAPIPVPLAIIFGMIFDLTLFMFLTNILFYFLVKLFYVSER